jgi:hypothetical protein
MPEIGVTRARHRLTAKERRVEYVIVATVCLLAGVIGGGAAVFFYLVVRRQQLAEATAALKKGTDELVEGRRALDIERKQVDEAAMGTSIRKAELDTREKALTARFATYDDLQRENEICKRDLRNIQMNIRKSRMDVAQTMRRQEELDKRSQDLAARYLKENVKIISGAVTSRNFTALKQRLLDVIEKCREIGFEVTPAQENLLVEDLKEEFEKAVRAELEREEQARIRAQIREEQKLQREIDRELKQAERERAIIRAALDRALAEAKTAHSQEIDQLQEKLAEAEARSQRAISQAQMTRAGNVYVISNIGSFGEGVYKVGMTRRLQPQERVKELGDASVPFPFDVHMMISCNDAPALENALHRGLHKLRVNKMNPRKEFFRTEFASILKIVEEHHGKVDYLADAEALEYRQSMTMTDADAEYVEEVYEQAEEEIESTPDGA